jgi:hypothetical protein
VSLLDRLLGRSRRFEPLAAMPLRGGGSAPAVRVPVDSALLEWKTRRENSSKTGYWPVILSEDAFAAGAELLECDDGSRPDEVLAEADKIVVADWLAKRQPDAFEELGEDFEYEFDAKSIQGRRVQNATFTIIDGLGGTLAPSTHVVLAEIPCSVSWQALAHRTFGGWNECPVDEVHCAMLREWELQHGAELVAISRDVMEIYVPRPISDGVVAKRAAQQMAIYAPDIVSQGTGTVRALAQDLMGSQSWFFWWD